MDTLWAPGLPSRARHAANCDLCRARVLIQLGRVTWKPAGQPPSGLPVERMGQQFLG